MIEKKNCFKAGKILKTHGIKGGLIFHFDREPDEAIEELESVLIDIDNGLVPFFITIFSWRDDQTFYAELEWISTEEEAQKIKGLTFYLPNTMKSNQNIEEFHVTGYRVQDINHGMLGTVQEMLEMPQQILMQVFLEGKEILIPLNDAIVRDIIPEENLIIVELPDGLVDLNG